MENKQFIETIAGYVQKYLHMNNLNGNVVAAIVAQSVLESGFGSSELALNANNVFGIKWKTTVSTEYYVKTATEQRADGTYYAVNDTKWCKFNTLEECVIGYMKFTSTDRYAKLKQATNSEEYLTYIKEAGYATSLNYVSNLLNVISKYNLEQYNIKEEKTMAYTNSSLVTYTRLTTHKKTNRTHAIDTITIHCIVGQWTAKQGCDYFATTTRECSANYVVGKDGSIGLSVQEKDRSFCSSNASNDNRAITIEVASDTTEPYSITNEAYEALIKLCADICKRNGISKLVWSTSKDDRVNHKNGCNMTCHRDFAAKSCPGTYIYEREGEIAKRVNDILTNTNINTNTATTTVKHYRVQVGYYGVKANAIAMQEKLKKLGIDSIIKEE